MRQALRRAILVLGSLGLLASQAWAQGPGPLAPASASTPAVQSLQALAAQRLRERAALATPMSAEAEAQRQSLLQQARQALSRGQSAEALVRLDAAAALSHAADTEMLIVQAQLQQGEFRQALSFASHAAGAHLYEPQALGLYAWLLALSEQSGYAARLLDEGLRRMPGEPSLLALQTQLNRLQAEAAPEDGRDRALARPLPWRVNPPAQSPADDTLQALSSGLLIEGGRSALVPLAALQAAAPKTPLWVSNGLGHGSAAEWQESFPELGLARLALAQALPQGKHKPVLKLAPREAFAGSVASAFSHLSSPQAAPAWPAMHSGFLGRIAATEPASQTLGIGLPATSVGGPVFDASGRWIGLLMPPVAPAQEARLLPSRQLAEKIPGLSNTPVQSAHSPMGAAQLYEQALPLTVQVFAHKS